LPTPCATNSEWRERLDRIGDDKSLIHKAYTEIEQASSVCHGLNVGTQIVNAT